MTDQWTTTEQDYNNMTDQETMTEQDNDSMTDQGGRGTMTYRAWRWSETRGSRAEQEGDATIWER